MSPFLIVPISLIIGLPFFLILASVKSEQETETPEYVVHVAQDLAKKERGEEVYLTLKAVYFDLQKQKGGGYGPWLSCCLERVAKGQEIDDGVALTALRFTRRDLAGSRYNLDAIDAAIAKLEKEEGEGA